MKKNINNHSKTNLKNNHINNLTANSNNSVKDKFESPSKDKNKNPTGDKNKNPVEIKPKDEGAKNISIIINGTKVICNTEHYIIDIAKENGIEIPHLCLHERLERTANCRLCIVDITLNGKSRIATSCSTKPVDGMIINTHTPKVLEARRINLELLLANHDLNCPVCPKNLNCKLQSYSSELMIKELRFEGARKMFPVDNSSPSIRRDNNRCILCGRCIKMCNDIQTVYAIEQHNRGFNTVVSSAFFHSMGESSCVNCGQCVIACPTGALTEKSDIQQVIDALNNAAASGKILIAQTAPSIRATLGECFGMKPGTNVTGKMVAALKKLGFNLVFDTNLAADITIIEEANEFLRRFKSGSNLPMITTCCPAWIKFGEQFYFEELGHMSTCRSPQAIMASLVKTYFAQRIGKNPKDIILIDIMPCTAKKFEIQRPEFIGEADFVLTTVELGKLIKELNVDFVNLADEDFDNPLGESTGAGAIFGHTGGVMEAALRTVLDWLEHKNLRNIEYTSIRGMDTCKEASLEIDGKEINICVVHTLGEARKIMEAIKAGKSKYHFIEIMACYGGCIGGGGQPSPCTADILKKRVGALISEDERKEIRKSHKNPAALKIYSEFLGDIGSEKAHKLLHTSYYKRDYK